MQRDIRRSNETAFHRYGLSYYIFAVLLRIIDHVGKTWNGDRALASAIILVAGPVPGSCGLGFGA